MLRSIGRAALKIKEPITLVLYGRHYNDFVEFCIAIDGCLANISTKDSEGLASLMKHIFQRFNPASFLAA